VRVAPLPPDESRGGQAAAIGGESTPRWGETPTIAACLVFEWGMRYLGEQKVNRRCLTMKQKMSSSHAGLVQRWVSVTDDRGRERLEAHWVDASVPSTATHAA
jgi:hypothetical protein